MSSSSLGSFVRRGVLVAVLPIGLIACGSSNPPPPKQPSGAIGGGPGTVLPQELEPAAPLLNSVTTKVPGMSSSQAATGVGSLLGLAQSKLSPQQFHQIAQAVPGSNALINGAVQNGLPTSGLNNLSSLNGVFDKAGITPTQVSEMIPVVGDSIKKTAGPTAQQNFLSAVK
jgi:hypothetical protein